MFDTAVAPTDDAKLTTRASRIATDEAKGGRNATPCQPSEVRFSFFKGADDVVAPRGGEEFDWEKGALRVRENLHDALNAKNLAFLFGSGCSSLVVDGKQRGIDTMAPLANEFLGTAAGSDDVHFASAAEREALTKHLGFDLNSFEFASNLERLMEVLYSFQFVLKRSSSEEMAKGKDAVDTLIEKATAYVTRKCSEAPFSKATPRLWSSIRRSIASWYTGIGCFRDHGSSQRTTTY